MKNINESFTCEHCGADVAPHVSSSRNHCPECLYSKHMDLNSPGDRLALCGGLMKPLSLEHDGKKGYMIVHQCEICKKRMKNKVADDDNWDMVVRISNDLPK